MAMAKQGRFVWYDLMTTDVDAAQAFYQDVIGWNIATWDGGGSPYTMWQVGNDAIGGVVELSERMRDAGAPPHWRAYIAVSDVDATVALANSLGGTTRREPWDVAEVGRLAVMADPQGAVFTAFTPTRPMPNNDGPTRPGQIGWHELATTDHASALAFYSKLFDWQQADAIDMGPEIGSYQLFRHSDQESSCGGMFNSAKIFGFPPHWLYYIQVRDLDGAMERATAGGGTLVHGPEEVPGGSRIVILHDPQGAEFALISTATQETSTK